MKKLVLVRIPPGDIWVLSEQDTEHDKLTFPTLTTGLNAVYKKYHVQVFEVDAREGKIYINIDNEDPEIEYDLYGDKH